MNTIMQRRSIRKFLPTPVEKEKIISVLRAAMQAPSAANIQPWEFLVVTDKETRDKVAKVSPYGGFCSESPLVIIVLGSMKRARPENLYWVEDLSAATQNILLQLEEEGLGGCWIGTWPTPERIEGVREIFDLPEHIIPFSIIACGYKGQERPFVDRFEQERIHWEQF